MNAPGDYLDFAGLAARLAEDLAEPLHTSNPLAITQAYASERGLEQLYDAICDLLPETEQPGECHELLMSFDWDRVFTTNYDLLLENTAASPVSVAATNLEYRERYYRSRLVVKLCGDRNHKALMRATEARLDPRSLRKECFFLYDDLLHFLKRSPFLFIGYSLSDPFMRYVRSLVDVLYAEGDDSDLLEPPVSFMITFDLSPDQVRAIKQQQQLVAVNLDTTGSSKEEAVREFLQSCLRRGRSLQTRSAGKLGEGIGTAAEYERLSHSDQVPVFTTGSDQARRIVTEVVQPELEELGKHAVAIHVPDQDEYPLGADTQDLLASALCAIVVYDRPCVALDSLVEVVFNLKCRPIILCSAEAHLGGRASQHHHARFGTEGVGAFVTAHVSLATTETRLRRAGAFAHQGDYDTCVSHAWRAVEEFLREAARAVLPADLQRRKPRKGSTKSYVKALKRAGILDASDVKSIARLEDLRNRTMHPSMGGYLPDEPIADEALQIAREIARKLTFDLPGFVDTLRRGQDNSGDGQIGGEGGLEGGEQPEDDA